MSELNVLDGPSRFAPLMSPSPSELLLLTIAMEVLFTAPLASKLFILYLYNLLSACYVYGVVHQHRVGLSRLLLSTPVIILNLALPLILDHTKESILVTPVAGCMSLAAFKARPCCAHVGQHACMLQSCMGPGSEAFNGMAMTVLLLRSSFCNHAHVSNCLCALRELWDMGPGTARMPASVHTDARSSAWACSHAGAGAVPEPWPSHAAAVSAAVHRSHAAAHHPLSRHVGCMQ